MYALPQELPGTKWRLLSLLGAGGHAEVYLAEHIELEHRMAVKVLQARHSAREELISRLRQEARILAKLRDHPGIAAVHDFGKSTDGRAFFVMDHVQGRSLRQAINERGHAFSVEEAASIVAECAEGLHAAHEQGVIHRDIKPENVMLTTSGHVKLLDFGIAKAMQEIGYSGTQTANGFVLGTPHYMAPEQAMARPVSAATDVYALGCCLFELVTGAKVYDGEPMAVIYSHTKDPVPTLGERLGREAPRELELIVARLLAKDPRERFATSLLLAQHLRHFLAMRPPWTSDLVAQQVAQRSYVTPANTPANYAAPEPTGNVIAPPTARATPNVPSEAYPTGNPPRNSAFGDGNSATSTTALPAARLPAPSPPPTPSPSHASELGMMPTEMLPAVTGDRFSAPSAAASPSLATATPIQVPVRGGLVTGETQPIAVSKRSWAFVFLGAAVIIGLLVSSSVLVVVLRGDRNASTATTTSGTTNTTTVTSVTTATNAPTSTEVAAPVKIADVPSAIVDAGSDASTDTGPKPKPTTTANSTATPKGPYESALASFNAGDLATAESEARKAGNGPTARLLLAQILEREGKTGQAHAIYEDILRSNPQMTAALEGLKRTGG